MLKYLIAFFCLPIFLLGQNSSITSITAEDGLSQGMIFDIIKDKDGFLWFATKNGLNRYDGHNFKVFTHDPFDSSSISGDVILSLLEDSAGRFWVNTESNGLNYFDKEKETFYPIKLNTTKKQPFKRKNRATSKLVEDKNGNIWLWEKSTLKKINITDFQEQLVQGFSTKIFSNIEFTYFDENGRPWISFSNQTQFSEWSGQKNDFIPTSRKAFEKIKLLKLQKIENFEQLLDSSNTIKVKQIYQEDEWTTWLGTNGFGIKKVVDKPSAFRHLIPNSSVRYIKGMDDNRMAILSYHHPSILDNKTGKLSPLSHLWSGGFLKSQTGEFWVGKNAEKSINPKQGILIRLDENLKEKKYYPHYNLVNHFLVEDKHQNLWTTPQKSDFAKVNALTDSVSFIDCHQFNVVVENGYTQCLYLDGQNNLWKGQTTGLIKMTLDENQQPIDCHFYQSDKNNPKSLRNNSVASCMDDPVDPETYLWIGTKGGGLNKLNKKTGEFEHFTTKDGLPNNVVYGILSDEEQNLWLSTNKGLSKFNPAQNTFKNYRKADGLQEDEFNTNAHWKNEKTGELFFGGINGITAFHPKDIQSNEKKPKVYITDFKIHNETITIGQPLKEGGENPLTKAIEFTNKINLAWHQNQLTFQFVALDYESPDKNQYKYKLTGVDQDWTLSDKSRIANYSNLGAGNYVFEVLGSNGNGVWNEVPTRLEITIYPPWWRTWWAYLTYCVFSILAIYLMYRFQIRRAKLKNQLRFEQKEAERLAEIDKIKSNFFTNITHELRTPLTLIIEPLRQLLQQDLAQEVHSDINLAKNNSEKLLNLVNELLDVSKLEANKMSINLVRDDVVQTLNPIIDSFKLIAVNKNIDLQFIHGQNINPFYFDKNQLEKIIHNLLSNALKFTNKGSVLVSLYLEKEGVKDWIKINVEDTGIGISEEQMEHIFDRFYQVESVETKKQSGTGVGLSLVKELVELQGGKIKVESRIGEGTKFKVFLPLITKTPSGVSHLKTSNHQIGILENEISSEDGVKNQTDDKEEKPVVLIVEDNDELRSFIRRQVQENYQILEATNGIEGIDMAIANIPELIISDVMMPEKTGFELVESLKNEISTSHIPIILLTAKTEINSKLFGLKQGADAYVTKPFHTEEILVRIANLIDTRRKLQAKFSKPHSLIKAVKKDVNLSKIDTKFVNEIKTNIQENLSNDAFSVETLAANFHMSRSQLFRKMKALTGQSPNEFIRNYRLDHAMKILRSQNVKIIQLAFSVGFSDEKYFSKCFKNRFNILPSEVKAA